MNKEIKMLQLIRELNSASELYYNGKESFLTDKEFDLKLEELKQLEKTLNIVYSNSPTINVGAKVLTSLNKVNIIDKPMLSLDKVHLAQEIFSFALNEELVASIKCDGLSVRLIYENGTLSSANTRGNGREGSDITEHIKYFLNVPLKINKQEKYIIDGEAIIYNKDFEIVNKNNDFKNNRNTASGSLALLDMSIVKNRRLSFIGWDVVQGASTNFYYSNLKEAENLGFTITSMIILKNIEEKVINEINNNILDEAKQKGIPCDGVVWRINNIKSGNKRGKTEHHFLNAVAWKPANEEYETTLKYIDYDVSRNGILTPVAVFEPIDIDGSTVERASLHNMSVMFDTLGVPFEGEKIWVIKSNMIIPQITRAEIDEHRVVTQLNVKCPVCGETAQLAKSDNGVLVLYCPNDQCQGKLAQRIGYYCSKKGLDIKGLSRATIEKLINWGWVENIIDIYKLHTHQMEWMDKPGFGKVSVFKILDAIDNSRNDVDLSAFIAALGIPLVGKVVAKELCKYYPTWEEFKASVGGDWTVFDGIGPEISKAINSFNFAEADHIVSNFLSFKETEQTTVNNNNNISEKVFVVTGKLKSFKNRDELKKDIESFGGKVTDSISSKTNYLINNDIESTSSKNKKAKELGIPIISEEDYIKLRS